MKELKTPTRYADFVRKYQTDFKTSAIVAEIIKHASVKGLNPKDEETIRSLGSPYGLQENFTREKISELEKDGLLEKVSEKVKTKRFRFIPQKRLEERLKSTEGSLYVLNAALMSGYKHIKKDYDAMYDLGHPILTELNDLDEGEAMARREAELTTIRNAIENHSTALPEWFLTDAGL